MLFQGISQFLAPQYHYFIMMFLMTFRIYHLFLLVQWVSCIAVRMIFIFYVTSLINCFQRFCVVLFSVLFKYSVGNCFYKIKLLIYKKIPSFNTLLDTDVRMSRTSATSNTIPFEEPKPTPGIWYNMKKNLRRE